MELKWRGDGKEIFYLGLDRRMMVAGIDTRGNFAAGEPRALFSTPLRGQIINEAAAARNYDVTRDGQRFLMVTPMENSAPSVVTVTTELQTKPFRN